MVSATGLTHGYEIVHGAVLNAYGLEKSWPFVVGYLGMAVVFWGALRREPSGP
jgi:hypothetical protein